MPFGLAMDELSRQRAELIDSEQKVVRERDMLKRELQAAHKNREAMKKLYEGELTSREQGHVKEIAVIS